MYEMNEGLQEYLESCAEFENQNLSKRNNAIAHLVVEDPVGDDNNLSATSKILVPYEPSDFQYFIPIMSQ